MIKGDVTLPAYNRQILSNLTIYMMLLLWPQGDVSLGPIVIL